MSVSHYDADHLGGVTDVGASLSGLEAVYNRSVGRDTPPNEPEGDERASKGSERMPNRAIMPKHQVSSREMSVLLRIQANGTHLRPLSVATCTRRKRPNVLQPWRVIPTNLARYGVVAGHSRAGRDSNPRPPDP